VEDLLMIELDGASDAFLPGETVSGRIEWAFEDVPDALALRLLWYTEGRGDRDAGVARSLHVEAPGAVGSQRFDLELPAGPYTFSGRLVSLIWALEAVATPRRRVARREIVVGPQRAEIVLQRADA
jgi:hypothetical protein